MSTITNVFAYVILVTIATCVSAVEEKKNALKLSDLPPLKRWEIATTESRDHLGRIGRKYKNLDNDQVKRSHQWEAAADVTPYDLGPAEDPQRVALDLHQPRSYLKEAVSPQQQQQKFDLITKKSKTVPRSNFDAAVKKTTIKATTRNHKHNKIILGRGKRRRLIALKPFLRKTYTTSKKRSKRSIDDFPQATAEEEYLYDDEEDNDGEFQHDENEIAHFEEQQNDDEEERRIRRAIDIGNAIKRARIIQSHLSNLKNSQSNDRKKTNKRTTLGGSNNVVGSSLRREENLVRLVGKSQRSPKITADTNKRSSTAAAPTFPRNSKQKNQKSANGGDEKKDNILIQKSFFPETDNHNTIRHIVPQRSSSSSAAVKSTPVDVKIVSKSHLDNLISSSPKAKSGAEVIENPVDRQHISQPRETKDSTTGINTANVARAVAVAMEQLKRDQMWGKVFVHVRPSGELKVMVQETRKMNDDSN